MSRDQRLRAQASIKPALDLPPLFNLITLREVGDAFAYAKEIASTEGAGTIVYVGRFDLAEFAVVFEPDEPLRSARRAFYAGCVALADALAFYAPPEKPISFDWPGTIRIDGGLVGGGRLAWPQHAPEEVRPDWLVFGAMIRTVALGEDEPGVHPLAAALEQEGFDDAGSGRLVESFARHLMVAIDAWREKGFGEMAKAYVQRLKRQPGIRSDIDENGDLLIRGVGGNVERHVLISALEQPSWLDSATGGPRR